MCLPVDCLHPVQARQVDTFSNTTGTLTRTICLACLRVLWIERSVTWGRSPA